MNVLVISMTVMTMPHAQIRTGRTLVRAKLDSQETRQVAQVIAKYHGIFGMILG